MADREGRSGDWKTRERRDRSKSMDGRPKMDSSPDLDCPDKTEPKINEERMKDIRKSATGETHGGENKDFGTGVRPDQWLQEENKKMNSLFHRLHLEGRHHNKLRAADVLQITKHSLQSHESCAEDELVQTFIQKLLMMNYRARFIHGNKASEQVRARQRDNNSEDEGTIFDNVFKVISLSNNGTSQSDQIHPMDIQMAVFHCADGFLKQLMVTKLSQCQYALPLLVPDPFTQQIEFPLWTFRQINKSWKMRNTNNEAISQTQPIYKAETPMVFFFRFGSVSSSKSQLMNSLINEKHNTFFHRNCPGSSRTRVLMDGVVEIAWFCSSGSYDDKFTECLAFCNLHGDAGDHEKQLQILTEMASVNVVLLPRLDRNDRSMTKLENLYKDSKPLIFLLTEDVSTLVEIQKGKYKVGLKDRSQADVSEALRRALNDCLSESSYAFRLEDVSKHSDIRVDEEDDDDCRRGREAAQQMMSLLEKKDLREIKESFLPHQGKLWHQWSQKNKELHRPQGDEIEMDISRKQTDLKKIRKQQHQLATVQTELEGISEELQDAVFGLEHIMREIGQIYESCSSVNENKKDLQIHFSSLPSLAAEMMISGFPLELMDGDAAHVPVIWISAVLDELVQKLGDQRVFVLSVLGIQSSGKSTMLNAMFGLQFAVSAGRCTRGAFMQLIRVSDEMKTQMNFDYILVVDTEGLPAIFGEIICQKLKEPIEQSLYKKTARELANEMRTECASLKGNRSNLEKHILKTLAEEEDFDKYMDYIDNPRDHFKSFIRDEVRQYINDKFSISVLPKMKENTKLLQQKIMKAAHESTEHVQVNSGDAGLWLKSFTQQLSDELIFSQKHLSGVKHDDVDDFNLLEDVIRQELNAIMSDISSRFNKNTFPENLDYKFRPDELLIDHLCQCCWVQCPFCKAICTNTIENHGEDHSVPFHQVIGLSGIYFAKTNNLSVHICTSAVAKHNLHFHPIDSEDKVPWREYRRAGGVYANWSITPDLSELPYWKWFVCRFQKDLEKHYSKTFEGQGKIPDEWRKYSKHDAIESLDKYI
ncbi:interferon-induced very large GTPase 1-like [Sinocyclocheilus grahami]|uniref:interferon-induced very large GTPase 1-like n=1 Tax=Sinocyclocheilus grahami TaxID=75366 RepID=UPI0007AD63C3|nr:PREDICTED: interferon-induced very large GTPase 1-like [Sinocyclocheilus grahami]